MVEINLLGPCNQLGYGIATVNILKALRKQGHYVAFFPIYGQVEAAKEDYAAIKEAVERAEIFSALSPSLKIWHAHDMADGIGNGPRYGMPFFEVDRLSPRERHHLSSLRKALVPSKWAADVLIDNNVPNVGIVPLGVDTEIFHPFDFDEGYQRQTPTMFLSVGKWELRKGHDVIIKAFMKAFPNEQNVNLTMVCYNPFLSKEENEKWASHYEQPGRVWVERTRLKTQHEIAKIMQRSDCGVFPARAEGWNLELLEMMACGKPVIATNVTAHTEFVTPENTMIVDTDGLEPAYDGQFFKNPEAGNWHRLTEKTVTQISEYMRYIHESKQRRAGVSATFETPAPLFNHSGLATAKRFSWENTAKTLVKELM